MARGYILSFLIVDNTKVQQLSISNSIKTYQLNIRFYQRVQFCSTISTKEFIHF